MEINKVSYECFNFEGKILNVAIVDLIKCGYS